METGELVASMRVLIRRESVPRSLSTIWSLAPRVECPLVTLPNLNIVSLIVEGVCADLVSDPNGRPLVDLLVHDLGLSLDFVYPVLLRKELLITDHPSDIDGPNCFGLLVEVSDTLLTHEIVLVAHVRVNIVARTVDDFETAVGLSCFITAKLHLIGPLIEAVEAASLTMLHLLKAGRR